jgi:hypothetical protein
MAPPGGALKMTPTVLQVNPDIRMEWDGGQVIMTRRVTRTPKGKEKGGAHDYEAWDLIGYYSGFPAAAKKLLDLGIGQMGTVTVAQFIAHSERIAKEVRESVAKALEGKA